MPRNAPPPSSPTRPRLAALLSVVVAAAALASLGQAGCAVNLTADGQPSGDQGGGEPGDSEDAVGVPITEPDETDTASTLAAAPLDVRAVEGLFDVRGVGDSAWSRTHQQDPIAAEFGKALDRFDATGNAYRGHATYINWETVVGERCETFDSVYTPGKSYAFVSRVDNLKQAMDRGFNLVGLSNNHSRDCTSPNGETMTATATAALADAKHQFHGVGDPGRKNDVRITTLVAQGKSIRVAFGSLYLGSRRACTGSVCANDKRALFENLRSAAADLRVVAIHSMDSKTQDELVNAGIEFVKSYDGDVVFGSGPHVWKPVRVVRKQSGKAGVVFESLGNFLHPSLAAQQKNYIGRALFDPNALVLRQVQVIPVYNTGSEVKFSTADLRTLPANLKLKTSERGGFANVKP